ncbi:hypothetical protein [Sphingomonas bacterium]|uniref:hypothetical protein n=1 Tax=Sphingomonas bacterium TaxID=1895847 RepID=UPI00157740B9|nr:hypothetical protein [Sphingomonas bacterium]
MAGERAVMKVAAIALAGLLAASAAWSSIPPPPPDDAPFIAASCGVAPMGSPAPVAATVTPLAIAPTKDAGTLAMRWGVRIATHDRRVADVTALAFSGPYGLIATTGSGDWLTFDLQAGTLAGIKAVGIAPMRGAVGRPTSMADLYGSLSFVAFAGGTGKIARYALSACGTDATAVPWLTTDATPSPFIVQAAYTYLGIAAPDSAHGDAVLLPYDKRDVVPSGTANPFVPVGERLVALANPTHIVPYILALTRPANGDRSATLRLVYRERWGDIWGGPPIPPRMILTFTRSPSAMAAFQAKSGLTTVILAFPTETPGTIDVYRFDGKL